ncbi:MAG: sulfotransferase [Candidatus Rokuibacteriota bacterium]
MRLFPFRRPPIVLLSYPRSGSSWIGRILGTSGDVAYLREPINQQLQRRGGSEAPVESVVDPRADVATSEWYTRVADRAFAGIVPRSVPDVVVDPSAFALRERRRRRLLIKEVNPLAIALLMERYRPQIVLLLRHPAAVADSYERLGWLGGAFEEFGRLYGTHLAQALEVGSRGWLLPLRYEDVARDPGTEVPRLFTALDIRPPSNLPSVLREYCEDPAAEPSPYEIRRASTVEADKWRRTMAPEHAAAVMRGYLASSLRYYREE